MTNIVSRKWKIQIGDNFIQVSADLSWTIIYSNYQIIREFDVQNYHCQILKSLLKQVHGRVYTNMITFAFL